MEYKAPQKVDRNEPFRKKIFLAGTIDMGNSEDWQKLISNYINRTGLYADTLNPRRDDWDSSWKQEYENEQFNIQVNWELTNLENADLIIMNFEPLSQSPITLLELGLYANSKKLVVICPKQFWRSGNVEIVCDKYKIPVFSDLKEFCEEYLYTETFWKWCNNIIIKN